MGSFNGDQEKTEIREIRKEGRKEGRNDSSLNFNFSSSSLYENSSSVSATKILNN
jgi:hypothetical protein